LIYDVNGFRPPWAPIVVSDQDSGAALRQLLFTAAAMLSLWSLFSRKITGRELTRQLPVAALGMGLVLSVLYSSQAILTVKRAVIFNMGILLLVGLLASSRRPVRQMQLIVVSLTAVAAWVSILGFVAFPAAAVSLAERPGLAGVSGHPNTLAPCMVIGWIVSLGLATQGSRQKAWLRLAQAGQLLALWLSNSITSIVLLLVSLLFYKLLTLQAYRRGIVQLALVSAIVLIVLVGPQNAKSGAFAAAGRDESLSGRDTLWREVWQEGMKSPVLGAGYGAFWYEGRGREIVGTWNPRQSHNAYVDVFVDLGALGLFAVLLVFAGGMWVGWARVSGGNQAGARRAAASMLAIAAAMMLVYAFGESFFFKLDKMLMFCLLWFRLLLGGEGQALDDRFRDV
jgi:O-antigen ligase